MSLISIVAEELRLDQEYVYLISQTASHRYKKYTIKKARGGHREINHPAKELKTLQYWLSERFLSHFSIHAAATAYKKGASIKKNASLHLKNPYLLRMDFENFFESITSSDLRKKIRIGTEISGVRIGRSDQKFMSNILFKDGRMVIGAPSSPVLSNLLMYEFDQNIDSYCRKHEIAYTRYADDLFFSCSKPNKLKNVERYVLRKVAQLECPGRLRINQGKTRHSSKKGRRYVTGLTLTSAGRISLGRAKKKEIKSRIHKYLKSKRRKKKEKEALRGMLSYVKDVEPDFLNSLNLKYGVSKIASITD